MAITILDIASKTGFSKSTVHRALSGDPNVGKETAEVVRKYAVECGYEPNLQARALVGAPTYLLAMLLPNLKTIEYVQMLRGAERTAESNGYSILVFSSEDNQRREMDMLLRIKRHGVEGVIVAAIDGAFDLLAERLKEIKIPCVGIYKSNFRNADLVESNIEAGAVLAVQHLLELGHRRIGFITIDQPGDIGIPIKLRGYRKTLQDAGIEFRPEFVGGDEKLYSFDAGYNATMAMLQLPKPPTAFFVLCDRLSVGVADAIDDFGLKIPDDISLIGYDDKDFGQVMRPPLTTIKEPIYEIGVVGMELLLEKIKSPSNKKTKHVLLTPQLVVRGTCAPIKNKSKTRIMK